MSELHANYCRNGFSNLEYRKTDHVWGHFSQECVTVASQFIYYTEGRLAMVVPCAVFGGRHAFFIYTDEYCVGQITNTGKISEAYKWEERFADLGFDPALIKKIKDYLKRENK